MRDADVLDGAGGLPLAERGELGLPVDEVVDLHQIDRALQLVDRLLHLRDALRLAPRPHLRGDERIGQRGIELLELAEHLADRRLGATVHRRAIDHAAAQREKLRQHGTDTADVLDVERLIRADADRGQLLSRRWNRSRDDRAHGILGVGATPCEERGGDRRAAELEDGTSRPHGRSMPDQAGLTSASSSSSSSLAAAGVPASPEPHAVIAE